MFWSVGMKKLIRQVPSNGCRNTVPCLISLHVEYMYMVYFHYFQPSNDHSTTFKGETARPVEALRLSDEKRLARSQHKKVQFLSEWKFKDPTTGNRTFPENTPSDDVILQLGSPRSKLGISIQ